MLKLVDLVKRYPTGDQALKGVGLEIPDGQVMALIGPSGAGKSTLIRCVNRLVEPTSGSVKLNDLELTKLGLRSLRQARRRIGMIFQESIFITAVAVYIGLALGVAVLWLLKDMESEFFRNPEIKKLDLLFFMLPPV